MQGLCQGRNVTRSPGLTSTIRTIHLLSMYFRSLPKSVCRIDNLEKPPWRSTAIGNFMSVTRMRDGEGKAFWKVTDPGDFGCPEHLEDQSHKALGPREGYCVGSSWGPEVLIARRHPRGCWVNKEELGRSTKIREWWWEPEARGLRVGERKEGEGGWTMALLLLQGHGVCVNDLCPWSCCVGRAVSKAVVLLVCSRSEMKILHPTFCSCCFSGFSFGFFGFFFHANGSFTSVVWPVNLVLWNTFKCFQLLSFPFIRTDAQLCIFPCCLLSWGCTARLQRLFCLLLLKGRKKPSIHRRVNRISLDLLVYAMSNARLVTANCCL